MTPKPPRLSDAVRAVEPELVRLRRELHANPELAFEERWTQARILDALRQRDIPAEPLAETGVVAWIAGAAAGPVLLARADMDALPITERSGCDYASRRPGCMHACGHDAHVAMLLTAARLLARRPPARGAVRLVFQPAEERGAGAARMIADGVLADPPVDLALAMHVWSGLATGTAVCRDGAAMAGLDSFELIVSGRGTHAARPEEGVDPIPIAGQIAVAAQSLVARRLAPHQPAVLSFTAIQGGQSFNVIPERVLLRGTVRAYDSRAQQQLLDELDRLARAIADGLGGRAELTCGEHLPPLVNDAGLAARVRRAAAGLLGTGGVLAEEPLMVSEDFGLFCQRVPGAMLLLGCGDPAAAEVIPHHHPSFDVDERALAIGVELWLRLVAELLEGEG